VSAALALPRTARLLRPADFATLRREGRRLPPTRSFYVEFVDASDGARLGMAVSRRVSKLAVVRNRIRRTVRESFRLHRALLPSFDILVVARQHAAARTNAELRGELTTIWHKLAALKETGTPGTMRAEQ